MYELMEKIAKKHDELSKVKQEIEDLTSQVREFLATDGMIPQDETIIGINLNTRIEDFYNGVVVHSKENGIRTIPLINSCPECDSEARLEKLNGYEDCPTMYWVECPECGRRCLSVTSTKQAIKNWNENCRESTFSLRTEKLYSN